MSNNTERFTYTRDRLLKILVSAYNQGFLDGTKKRNSLDDLQFLADHEIGHAKVEEAQLPRVYYHSWITGPQGARFEIFKSNHSTEVINKTKSRLRYDQDVVKIYVVKGEPEDYDHKKERLEFYDIEEDDNG